MSTSWNCWCIPSTCSLLCNTSISSSIDTATSTISLTKSPCCYSCRQYCTISWCSSNLHTSTRRRPITFSSCCISGACICSRITWTSSFHFLTSYKIHNSGASSVIGLTFIMSHWCSCYQYTIWCNNGNSNTNISCWDYIPEAFGFCCSSTFIYISVTSASSLDLLTSCSINKCFAASIVCSANWIGHW